MHVPHISSHQKDTDPIKFQNAMCRKKKSRSGRISALENWRIVGQMSMPVVGIRIAQRQRPLDVMVAKKY